MRHNGFEVIFETVSGSRLYGTHHDGSDFDYRGICVTTLPEMVHPFQGFDQQVETEEIDRTIYHIQKFVKLASTGNPSIVELGFAPQDKIITMDRRGEYLLQDMSIFLTEKDVRKSFSGYAYQQLNRIKTHRGYLLDKPKEPSRSEHGLPEAPKFGLEKINNIIHSPDEAISPEWKEYAMKEKAYRSASENWKKYKQWENGRNKDRAKLEAEFGYDLKHANHLFRLLLEGEELLRTGKIKFPLSYVGFLKEILSGGYTYEEVIEMAERQQSKFDNCHSVLSNKVNYDKILEVYNTIIFGM